MLQYCQADNKVSSDDVFSTIYQGEQMSYLVTDIEPHVTYTFRVCGRSGNKDVKWGPWSAYKNGVTSLEPHGKFYLGPGMDLLWVQGGCTPQP